MYKIMVENNLTYEAWKEYLKSDREMNSKWKSLIALWENVKKDLKSNLEILPNNEALRRRKYLTAKNIFNVINTAREKPNFSWIQKLIYNEEDERHEYVIQCINPSSDYIFRKIKEERWVANMHWESIDKYLQPVADKIWALKNTLRISINPEMKSSDLSYDSLKIGKKIEMPEWAENHYAWHDRDIMDENWDIILNPEQEHIPTENWEIYDDVNGKEQEGVKKSEPRQLDIPFVFED